MPVFMIFLLPSTAGCTFDTHSDIGPCEVTQGTEDDFDWHRVQDPHGNTDLPQGEYPSSQCMSVGPFCVYQ